MKINRAAVTFLAAALGCGLFKELQSVESAGDDDSGSGSSGSGSSESGGSETEAPPCEVAQDDRCEDQDTLFTCDAATGEVTEYACQELCGANLNFTCLLATNDGQHGCFCVAPGIDASTCAELESCLQDCTGAVDSSCSDKCFSRATTSTIRMYGALVYCAHSDCSATCTETPESCGSCIQNTIVTGGSACVVERSVCDADDPEDPY